VTALEKSSCKLGFFQFVYKVALPYSSFLFQRVVKEIISLFLSLSLSLSLAVSFSVLVNGKYFNAVMGDSVRWLPEHGQRTGQEVATK
jgi:hypothetical protein